jgi:signal transduction histidine kinase
MPRGRRGILVAVLLSAILVGWLLAVILTDAFNVVIFNPGGKTGFEMFLAHGQLFGALVLALASLEPARPRIRWVAMALLVLGIGALVFGYLVPLYDPDIDAGVSLYGSVLTRTLATTLLAVGLVPPQVPLMNRRVATGILLAGTAVTLLLVSAGEHLPTLMEMGAWESVLDDNSRVFPGLTMWHHALGAVPLVASLLAVWGVFRQTHDHLVGGWLAAGVVLFAGAQLHALFWPSGYSSILTTTSILRFAWTGVVIFGAIVELYALSRERSQLLAEEQERVRQLEDLNMLKRDFSSMVAHELGTPLAAIGNLAQMITMGVLPEDDKQKAASRIQGEARILQLLVRDVQESADIERDDFSVRPRAVSLGALLEDARSYAGTVRTSHPITLETPEEVEVMADPERIGQVIRNLLNNAVRHTPRGTPIRLGAYHDGDVVCVEVVDKGPGIDPQDRLRILEKFGRGSGAGREGRGLGLYLSQRILHAHGTELSIESGPGEGACFSFRLKEAS